MRTDADGRGRRLTAVGRLTADPTELAAALRDRIMELVRDMNGNHVVQRCLASMTTAEASFIFDRVAADCLLTATHRHG